VRINRLVKENPPKLLWRTVKLVIGFEGTRYEGWQSQRKEGKTIQEVFERALYTIFEEKTNLVSSSRTDSGVHALGLVAHLKTKNPLPDDKLKAALNFYLPKDIVVFSVKTVRSTFHARFKAKSKLYRYDIWHSKTRPLFEAPFVFWYPHPLSINLMRKAAAPLVGKHDFNAFKDRGDEKLSTVRHIHSIRIKKVKEIIRIEITANGFLRHMVRIIVGTLIEAGRKRIKPKQIQQILLSKDRSKAGPTAKALGLTLVKVNY
jgi:tRNA pseudouridine38-40 synthase